MIRKLFAVFVLLISQSAIGQTPAGSKQDTGIKAEIIKYENQIWDYWKAQKPDAMKALIADDAIFPSGDGILDKQKAITVDKSCVAKSIALQNANVMLLGPDAAMISYKAVIDGTCGGKPIKPSVNNSVWAKRGGKWLTVAHSQFDVTK
jgi:hypothetical protein